jgi:soluble lytic murein transglycosylase
VRRISRAGWKTRIEPLSPGEDRRPARTALLAFFVATLLIASLNSVQAATNGFEMRAYYQQAREKLRQGRLNEFKKLATRLQDYPLRPYLDYHYLRDRLNTATSAQVLAFTSANPDLPVTSILHRRWLKALGRKRRWQELRDHYQPSTDSALRCYHLRALYATGSKQDALDQTTAIWLQPVSQPKACDPLFEIWRTTPRFTENIVWQRFEAAIMANQRTLARYLIRFLSGTNKNAADAFYGVHVSPSRVTRTESYQTDTPRYRTLIAHGLIRLASRDESKASVAWQSYRKSHDFDSLTVQRIDANIALGLANTGSFPSRQQRASFTKPDVVEDFASTAVTAQNWSEASFWISQLPSDIKNKSRWQYWLGRALEQTKSDSDLAKQSLVRLAEQRHYYGFLAARELGIPGRMNGTAKHVNNLDLARIQRLPGIERSIELFAVSDELNGRREWYRALNSMSSEQQVIAAELAQTLGLVSMAIQTANIAEATNHLHLRFPVVYEPQFRRASLDTTVPVPLLIAIARQESAMEASARSSADARGLMQLLPSTARMVARRANMSSPSATDLYDPGTNIGLGSYHLAWLIARYDGQTPLAIAAYNAGEHRIDRWIKEAQGVPMDVWIEQIPFRETRSYVKNVLAFRHVYSKKLHAPTPMLTVNERLVRIP